MRTSKSLSQKKLAEIIGIAPSQLSRIENGETQNISSDILIRLAKRGINRGAGSGVYRFCQKKGIKIVGVYADRSISGRTDNRVEFQRMLKDTEKGLFDCIIVWKIDRFGRNREEIAVNKIRCRKNGVKLLYAKEHIPEGPAGILLESLLEGLAEFYSAELSEKIIRGLTENALKGKVTSGPPGLGYKVDKDKRLVVDELEAPIVRRVFEMFSEGFKYVDIVNEMNAKGYKTKKGGEFNKNSIQRILKNQRYIGKHSWNGIDIPVPPIVTVALFMKCQDKIKKIKNVSGRGKASVEYLLSGKLYCGHCQANMNGESGTGRHGGKFYYYKCATRKVKKSCTKENAKKAWIEQLVADVIYTEVLSNDDVIEQIADSVMQIQRQEHDGSLLASLEAQLDDVQRSIKNLLKLVEQGTLTTSTGERLAELEESKEDLSGRIVVEKLLKTKITKEQVIFWFDQFKELGLTCEEGLEKIIDTFIHSVFLFDDKVIITGNYADDKGSRKTITLEDVKLDSISTSDIIMEDDNTSTGTTSGGGGVPGVRICSRKLHFLYLHLRVSQWFLLFFCCSRKGIAMADNINRKHAILINFKAWSLGPDR